ncbi:C-type lectin receptor-like tyrosine-protein kinase [Heracleum sosnowskyi]|uniref:C-type lectin receptor-like tyrosine-protein kinase n=1 Tax=Heracleum sosnowskyi TaxID=360622 RepID=A0AAD8IIV6_9APIA|nr:C-type lectin receptor-like tyrosine-protein kinase [Heracleum sosnowskyi]
MEMKLIYYQYLTLLIACAVLQLGDSSRVSKDSISLHLEASSGPCPSGWVMSPSKRKCFRYIKNYTSWDESERHCQGYHGHLAAIASLQELKFVEKLCGEVVNGCWIGGRRNKSTIVVDWRWSDNTTWNVSIIPQTHLRSNCNNLSCQSDEKISLCTLTSGTNGSNLVTEKCNSSHAYICMTHIENKCHHMHCHREYLISLAVVSGVILCISLSVVVWLLVYRRSKRRKKSRKLSNPAASALVPPSWKIFTREELRSMTKNFSEVNRLLGDAKAGGTYSGILPDGLKVAVKRLKRSNFQRKKEFFSEIGRVARLHHPNLVSVKGCCYDHGDRYIVYEFIVHGPLDRWLHHIPVGGRSLDWVMRMKIATTLAQGIAFLHDKVKPQVVHRDIQASNVLLDEDFGAHLKGVGLSKFVPYEVMHERTVMAGGTHGYLAPEFVYRNELTTKSDVYSFGVLLLEIVSGRRPAQAVDAVGYQSIFEWATPLVQSHRYLELLDPLISSSPHIPEAGVIQKVVDLVYSCTQHVPSMRPRMSHVVHQLQQLA